MESLLLNRLAILSHPQRMAVYKMLMRRCPDHVPAGEIARALGLKASTASVYLSALTRNGLVAQKREGTSLLYSVNLDAARELVTDLFEDCCRGRADLCPPSVSALFAPAASHRKFNVLFICTGNSARSIMAEALLRDTAADTFNAYSAGTVHRAAVHPAATALLHSKGHDTALMRSKNVSEFQGAGAPAMDFVFTVCDRAANEDCPTWPGCPVSGHWGVPDPAKATGREAEKHLAFQQTYGALRKRIAAFAALPFDTLDRATLQHCVDEISADMSIEGTTK